ncbi:MAG: CcoQ/FixQ family Cbb3-type cytochrome c oxidase assembly chaperone [Crocinitomicaceae bacterium]|nr:CcoQ/FixQ family Cbb3-type cytochrome c oxidase assembly chaperone [Crocinitomicaceae bacterium]MBP6033392.1 CcoQ/FixQ family Cbb3-type cytochrome c oxidase assembly chaperone [Crocinitomicaceae bacterium]
MLRFIKHNLTGMLGVEIYPLISLIMFTLFFAVMLWYVIKMSNNRVTEMSAMPLDLEENTNTNQTHHEN